MLAEFWWERIVPRTEAFLGRGRHHREGSDQEHLDAALDWLVRAHDASPDDGFARGYSLRYIRYLGTRGWQPSYPETTGYLIPTLLMAAHRAGREHLRERALRAARWEVEVQLPSGAVQGGVLGQGREPAVFNTGQVLFGLVAAWRETGDDVFAHAARRAGTFLVEHLDEDGHWRRGNSEFAQTTSTLYNARTAWGLAVAGRALGEAGFLDAARTSLKAVARAQFADGWFPRCCLNDPERPLLHTLAYTMRGLIEGGWVLDEPALVDAGARAAWEVALRVREDGFIPGRFAADWEPVVYWSCLTGNAQMVNIWLRLHREAGDARWIHRVDPVLAFLKRTHDRTSADPGVRGGVKGSWPMGGGYGPYEVFNWATKFFADALTRRQALASPERRDLVHDDLA
ncbi:MAG: hypothetical protein RQ751_11710 [Longimicrobiales bacterium]|nr:hypothetical protein [Longimicrobiales bacterium]